MLSRGDFRPFAPFLHEPVEVVSEAIVPLETDRYKGAKSAHPPPAKPTGA